MEKGYDIRNDEEQEKKSQEVLELLVTAGYFRARIKVNGFFAVSNFTICLSTYVLLVLT